VVAIEGMLPGGIEGGPDVNGDAAELFATGIVEQAPEWLACKGSRGIDRRPEHRPPSDGRSRRGERQGAEDAGACLDALATSTTARASCRRATY